MIWLGPVSLGGDTEEQGGCTGIYSHWGVSGSSHRLGVPVLDYCVEKTRPLCWLEDWLLGQIERLEKPGLHLWGMQVSWLAPEAGQREICPTGWDISPGRPTMHLGPSQANAPAPLRPHPSTALDLGGHNQGKKFQPGWHLRRARGGYISSHSYSYMHMGPPCFSTPCLWRKCSSVARGKNTHLMGT